MRFPQFLASQRWTEIRIAIPDDWQCDVGHAIRKLAVFRLATLQRDQPRRTFTAITWYQPIDLALGEF